MEVLTGYFITVILLSITTGRAAGRLGASACATGRPSATRSACATGASGCCARSRRYGSAYRHTGDLIDHLRYGIGPVRVNDVIGKARNGEVADNADQEKNQIGYISGRE